jgi:predicted ATP-dependent protease
MIEADFYARSQQHSTLDAAAIEAAADAAKARFERYPKRQREAILDGTLLISTQGTHVGQINGLAVVEVGNQRWGHPSKITATARLGDGNVADIERESELGGPIHAKGIKILTAFLANRYAHSMPLSLSASLVFEQSYGPVEGDSASLAELCALLSALSDLPIKQGLAVTGSINQFGEVQAIGGINEKIEGFFEICQARGFTGEQGVIMPQANLKHLMLNSTVVNAVRAGQFAVYAVEDVDQAMALLTGTDAGQPDEQGVVPPGSVNYLVAAALITMAQVRQDGGAIPAPVRGRGRRGKRHGK